MHFCHEASLEYPYQLVLLTTMPNAENQANWFVFIKVIKPVKYTASIQAHILLSPNQCLFTFNLFKSLHSDEKENSLCSSASFIYCLFSNWWVLNFFEIFTWATLLIFFCHIGQKTSLPISPAIYPIVRFNFQVPAKGL